MSDKDKTPEKAPAPEVARSSSQVKNVNESTSKAVSEQTIETKRNLTREEEFSLESMNDGTPVSLRVEGDADARAALFAKIVKVQKSVKVLAHTGEYNQGNTKYTYATERDVLEPISEAFAKNNVAIVPGVVGSWWHDMPGRYQPNRVTTVQIEAILGDAETGAYIVTGSRSTAANSDKATNAAFTTAFKYLLAKLAIVAFGDDADEYSADGEKAGTQKDKPKPLTEGQRKALTTKIKESGKGDDIKAWMKSEKVTFSKITDVQAAALREKFEVSS